MYTLQLNTADEVAVLVSAGADAEREQRDQREAQLGTKSQG